MPGIFQLVPYSVQVSHLFHRRISPPELALCLSQETHIMLPLPDAQLREQNLNRIVNFFRPQGKAVHLSSAVWTSLSQSARTWCLVKTHEAKYVSARQFEGVHINFLADSAFEIFFLQVVWRRVDSWSGPCFVCSLRWCSELLFCGSGHHFGSFLVALACASFAWASLYHVCLPFRVILYWILIISQI